MKKPLGVLMMAYGGPANLEEIPGYLADIRSGRTTNRAILEEITENYRQIGGRSPLPERTRAQVEALAARFDPTEVRFYSGMRHWSPWIEDTVAQMLEEGISQGLGLVLAPHYSSLSIDKYAERVRQGLDLHRGAMEWTFVKSYHTEPALIEAFVERVREGLGRWPDTTSAHVVFSAHALPARILKEGDPYQDQLWETADLVAKGANLHPGQWSWCYQSAGRTPEPWLGPTMEDHLRDLAGKGIKNVVSVPLGFVSDHVEILYDIDVKARALCQGWGIRLERPRALNDDKLFIDALEAVVRKHREALG